MIALDEMRARDLASVRCATCRMSDDAVGHRTTLDECEASLAADGRRPDEHGRYCWASEEHHEYVPGEVDDYPYDGAGKDRHALIAMVDELVGALSVAIEGGPVPPDHNTKTARGYARSVLAKYR